MTSKRANATRITSAHNPRFRQARRLVSSRGRKLLNRLIVFGWREVIRGITSGRLKNAELFVCPELLSADQLERLESLPAIEDVAWVEVPAELFGKLCYGDRVDGVVLIADRCSMDLERLSPSPDALVVVLEALEKPGNLGAIARSADGGGVDALIAASPRTDFFHPNAIRASLGTLFALQLGAGTTDEVIAWLRGHQFNLFIATPDSAMDYDQADYRGRCAIVLGSEAPGLTSIWSSAGGEFIKLPMSGVADSLNVATAAAVLIYNAQRQRRAHAAPPIEPRQS